MSSPDELLPFSKLLQRLKAEHRISLHVSTLHRYRTRGINGKKLAAFRFGGRWLASLSAVQQLCSMNAFPPNQSSPPTSSRAELAQQLLTTEFRFANAKSAAESSDSTNDTKRANQVPVNLPRHSTRGPP